MQSRKPIAKQFKKQVKEILKTIRHTGGYVNNDELFISTYMSNVDEETRQIFRASLQAIRALSEKVDVLEVSLNQSLQFFTVMKYNQVYKMNWNLKQCQSIGRGLSRFCRESNIEIKTCETNDERFKQVNSYPLTAWEAYIGQ